MNCPVCKKKIEVVCTKRKGGVNVYKEACCTFKRVREVSRDRTRLSHGYDACKDWR